MPYQQNGARRKGEKMNKRYLVEYQDDTTKGVFCDSKIVWAKDPKSAADEIRNKPTNWRIFNRNIIAVSELIPMEF